MPAASLDRGPRPGLAHRLRGPARLLAGLLLLATLGSGCKGDRDKCARAAQRFAELVYWERENAAIAKLPPAQRDLERKRKALAFERELDAQLDYRVHQCVAANNDEQADCINAAKTADEALACADIATGEETSGGCCDAGDRSPAGSLALAALVGLALARRGRGRAASRRR